MYVCVCVCVCVCVWLYVCVCPATNILYCTFPNAAQKPGMAGYTLANFCCPDPASKYDVLKAKVGMHPF